MKFFSYLNGLLNKAFPSKSTAQDSNLPLKISFKTSVSFETNPFVAATTHGSLLDVRLDNLKMLRVTAISSIKIVGMEDKKIHRFYFNTDSQEKRCFLQTLSAVNNVEAVEEILFCTSVTELPENAEDIAFFSGDNGQGLGEPRYVFSRQDLTSFLPDIELERRLGKDCTEVEYTRIAAEMEFMPAFTGTETRIFDAQGTTGESVTIMNLMPHTRSLQSVLEENLVVAFWVMTSKNGRAIAREDQLPVAEYIFSLKLEKSNISII